MLIDATGSHRPLLPEIRQIAPLAEGIQKFLRNTDFYLTSRNSPIVHVEPISGYLNLDICIVGELEFPSDLAGR